MNLNSIFEVEVELQLQRDIKLHKTRKLALTHLRHHLNTLRAFRVSWESGIA